MKCHCPTTGGIGDVDTRNIACLVSKSEDVKRKFPYTVEAVSCDKRFTNISSHSKNHIGPAQIIKKPVRQCRLQRKRGLRFGIWICVLRHREYHFILITNTADPNNSIMLHKIERSIYTKPHHISLSNIWFNRLAFAVKTSNTY